MTDFRPFTPLLIRNQQVAGSSPAGGSNGCSAEQGGPLSTVREPERPFVALASAANGPHALPHISAACASALARAWTELAGDDSALVVHASPWRWSGPSDGEIVGSLTLRRWCDGQAWDLAVSIVVDPDDESLHLSLVVRLSDEVRLAEGLQPIGQWWAPVSVLRPRERAAIDAAVEQVVVDPPPRHSFELPDAGVVRLRLDAGSLGDLVGELCVVATLGLAYVRATRSGALTPAAAARTMRTAVVDGRLAVPHWVRVYLERGGELLALEGGDL